MKKPESDTRFDRNTTFLYKKATQVDLNIDFLKMLRNCSMFRTNCMLTGEKPLRFSFFKKSFCCNENEPCRFNKNGLNIIDDV